MVYWVGLDFWFGFDQFQKDLKEGVTQAYQPPRFGFPLPQILPWLCNTPEGSKAP
jgi:hypothetical protein